MYPENKHHIFVELADGKVRNAKMLTLDEIRADGWESDPRPSDDHISSDWVRDPDTGEKLRLEPCDRWRMKNLVAFVSATTYPPTKRIEPLFGYTNGDATEKKA